MQTRLLLAFVGAMSVASSAVHGADVVPSRRLPVPRAVYVPFFTWSGFYLGINGGYGFGTSRWTDTATTVSTGDFNTSGFVVGGTAGYNMLFGAAVLGIEADIDWTDIHGRTTTNCPLGCETKNTWLGTARARLGYAFDRFLPYFTGGGAFGDIRATAAPFAGTTKTQFGWALGAGIEYAFLNNWSAKLEYLYVDLGSVQCPAASCGSTIDTTFQVNLIRGGVNYKF
jgi:outer membrane immunogenic protein